ncbi:hypothetical protein DKY63_21485 [Pseudomonas putida]|uniref:Uncharacterized protein n=1 Tax=Pseudomonas putida TaxID=303 RepID=A0A2Z4RQU5_PSEPU|nr:hypothetical protein DKY63_21485 [Pseudomonas putida]
MLAMVVNDNAGNQMPSGASEFFASMLAPTGGSQRAISSITQQAALLETSSNPLLPSSCRQS